ncbi:MAG: bifunctional adenosylcobinamide kinase/adenosylcobinamide-phosphate guanylyltransferase [Clostridiales bacterium]|nr:bifunctional adenosylcobinamide kinase/adenosylcobinamide-phosphate guanylyltransferase [Clostridiales bacterium]
MWIVVTGGSGSGKSAFAEEKAMELEPEEKIYIATMEPYDEESFRRIKRHQQMRKEKKFRTLECYRHLEKAKIEPETTILLECMSNLVANEMFHPEGRGEKCGDAIWEGLVHLSSRCRNLVVVTNNVFDDGQQYDEGSMRYLEILADINERMAARADGFYEVVCGIPLAWKKEQK